MSLFDKLFGKQGEGKGEGQETGRTAPAESAGQDGAADADADADAEARHAAEHNVAAQVHVATADLAGADPSETPPATATVVAREDAEAVDPPDVALAAASSSASPEEQAPAGRAEVLAFPGRPRAEAPADLQADPQPGRPEPPEQQRREPVSIASAQRGPQTGTPTGTPTGPQTGNQTGPAQPATLEQMRQDPNLVRVFDQYGQEVFVPKQQWRDEILPNNLQAAWTNPDELYAVMLNAVNDGLFAEIEAAAVHLRAIDPQPARAVCLLAIVQLQLGRTEQAERTLEDSLANDGEDAAVLTNLSRILAARGERERAEPMLWRAVELDPNLENAIGWYVGVEAERDPAGGRERALDRVAGLPGSWRARLWKAKAALDAKDLAGALEQYRLGLGAFPGPVSAEFLYPMSGDLGMAGHLRELIEMTEPYFLPEVHGLPVGNNLIKAHFDLGELEPAAAITARLFAMKRPDWREPLGFWEQSISRALRAQHPVPQQGGPLEIGMLEMIGPVWRRVGGPLEPVFGLGKADNAPVVTILGGSADLPPVEGEVAMQLADAVGRLTRAMPLFLTEQMEFHTVARARTLLPRVAQGGFVLRGGEWADAEALELARGAELAPDFVVRAHVDTRAQTWVATAKLARAADGTELGAVRAEFPAGQPEYGMLALASSLQRLLERQGVGSQPAPAVYQVPETGALANYLLRLEQLLILRSAATAEEEMRPASGEREVMEGVLGLALQQPANPTVRALMAATAMTMWRVRPEIAEEFEDRLELLGREQPLGEPLDGILFAMVTDEA